MRLRYPFRALAADYARGGFGFVLMVGMWLMLPGQAHVHVIFGGLTLLFALFTIRTAWRQISEFELRPEGIEQVRPQRRVLLWERLDSLRLRYYATRRNREGGWMTLTMRAGDVRCAVDSSLDGFEPLVAAAANAAAARRIAIDTATRANLEALSLDSITVALRRMDDASLDGNPIAPPNADRP
jgi:hypothetical protein